MIQSINSAYMNPMVASKSSSVNTYLSLSAIASSTVMVGMMAGTEHCLAFRLQRDRGRTFSNLVV